jgi:putative PEP-CTERM system histidine kinase
MNLEKTFRTAVGIMRWRIKFLVIGLGLILGVRAYICSQALLFSGRNLAFAQLDAGALIIGGGPIIVAYLRRGLAEADIYPSHSVLENSITIVLAGAYLFVVGILSQIIRHLGNASDFQAQAFIVLLGIAGLATVACSERLRLRLRQFVSRHFIRPSHDFRKIWTSLTERLSSSLDKNALCGQATGLISETFNALSVTIWLLDERNEGLTFAASTCEARPGQERPEGPICRAQLAAELLRVGQPFELASVKKEWASPLRRITSRQFRAEGICVCVPLIAKDRCLGVAILTDRVYNTRYTVEEFDLLKCIGDQLAGALLNLRFSEELLANKEIEAFQTMSLFLVHDLKNAASALNLTVRNLPLHFDDPAFRKDALQSISTTVGRMNQLISRLSAFRQRLELNPVEADLNELIRDALADLTGVDSVEIVQDLHPLPKLTFDREKVHSVVTNLLLNARDAVGDRGQITVRTTEISGSAVLSVADNGCGMTPEFVRDSLFRPFQTTKKKGLGIGIFQSKTIVEAHHGSIHVESEPGKSTTFRISLPIGPLS